MKKSPRIRFSVYKSKDGWRWRAKGRNGEIVATGEAHTRKHDAIRAWKTFAEDVALDWPGE